MSEEKGTNGTATTHADGGGEQPDGARSFTQAQMNAIINDRLERERKKYSDYDDIKSELDKMRADAEERKKAELSEVEKLQAELTEAQQARDNAVARVLEITTRAAIEREAGKAGFHDPSDAYALLDWDDFEVQDDGTVDGVEEAIKALAKAKPHLVQAQDHPDIDGKKRGEKSTPFEARVQEMSRRFGIRTD